MAHPLENEPQNLSKSPPPQTIILEPTPLNTSFQMQDRVVSAPQHSPFQLLEPMPEETVQNSMVMFFSGFFTPFIVCFLTYFVLDFLWVNSPSVWDALFEVSCYLLPLLYMVALIYSFSKGSRSFGKGLLLAAAVPVVLIGGLFLILYIEYGM